MRISLQEKAFLKERLKNLSKDAKLYLFGSRVDDSKKGGDIDLLVVSNELQRKDIRQFRVDFYNKFGEQKMDIILDDGRFDSPFTKMIVEKAILL